MTVREAGSGTREVVDRALAKRGQKFQRPPLVLGSTEAIKTSGCRGSGGGNRVPFNHQNRAGSRPISYPAPARLQLTRPLHRLCWRNRARAPAVLAFLGLLDERYPRQIQP